MAHVDAEVAGVRDRRAGDPHVHLGRAGVAHELDERSGGRAAHEGVVDHHHALAGEVLGEGVELECDAAVADVLGRLDERAADVAVLDQPVVERQATGRAYPIAAGIDESGTGITTSASTADSVASSTPSRWRTWWTLWPSHTESGREK